MALSRADWIEAALAALAEEGLAGVAVEPLARRVGATKGSFYWHFADRADLIAATLERWEQRDTTELIAALEAIPEPRERLRELGRYAYAEAARGADAQAGVLAAASDPRVGPALARVTDIRLAYLGSLYRQLDCEAAEARGRARLAYALYVGLGDLRRAAPGSLEDRAELAVDLELAVDVLLLATRATGERSGGIGAR